MTRSILFESIQQSPIDPLMADCSSELEGFPAGLSGVSEEAPNEPPRETALWGEQVGPAKLRLIDSTAWADQLGSGLSGPHGVSVTQVGKNSGICIANKIDQLCVSANGLFIDYRGDRYRLSDKAEEMERVPFGVWKLLAEGHAALAAWRSRVVRLSMDTDEYECSLMDDMSPPKTFLVELKNSVVLKSVRVQTGMTHWTTGTGRVVTVPTCILEQERDVKTWMHKLAPELTLVDPGAIWTDIIQLRAMCLDEDRRLSMPNDQLAHAAALGG